VAKNGERPDFIILNVFTADISGFETIQELMHLDRSLNVIMTSCSTESSMIKEAPRLGARDYLAIPFERAELDEAMLRTKQGKQLSSGVVYTLHSDLLASKRWQRRSGYR
jgi:response regulator of citrate/malate metabolism